MGKGKDAAGFLPSLALLAMLASASYVARVPAEPAKPEHVAANPAAIDLSRLSFRAAGVTVLGRNPKGILLASDDWTFHATPLDPGAVKEMIAAFRRNVAHSDLWREDCLGEHGKLVVHRFLRKPSGPGEADFAQYLISSGGAWLMAWASPTDRAQSLDVAAINSLIFSFRIEREPPPEPEAPPAREASR
jgi:hypothetical protein